MDSVVDIPQQVEAGFRTFDGVELFYRAWLATEPVQRAIVLIHRGHEHSGRWSQVAAKLAGPGTAVFAWDARGHGRSPGQRGYAQSLGEVIRDLDCFLRFICGKYELPMNQIAVVGHSVGAVTVAAWVHYCAPPIRAMVLATPAFRVKLYVPLAIPALRLRMKLGGRAFVKSYIRPRMITTDPDQAHAYARDELISRNIAVNVLLDLYDRSTQLLADAAAIRTPTLVLTAGRDWVVDNPPTRQFVEELSSPIKKLVHFENARHAIFHDVDRDRAVEEIRQFLDAAFAAPPTSHAELLQAHERGFTKDEFNRLACPLPIYAPRRWSFAAQTLVLKTLGRLSTGVQLGWRTGFDSGQTLDYVYQNRPRGITPLGRLIDRTYLNSIGWRGIRIRRQNLQSLLRQAIDELLARDGCVRLLDIAAGVGRYVLEILHDFRGENVSALLRDASESALQVARESALRQGLTHVDVERGDAFDRAALAAVRPKPNLAVISGLYELFGDNDRVMQSLQGVSDALTADGLLVYTCQPWHPQIEMIARVLVNRDGQPWIMRRRTQLEMDELVRAAGLEKTTTLVDQWGMFTVSIARKVGAGQS